MGNIVSDYYPEVREYETVAKALPNGRWGLFVKKRHWAGAGDSWFCMLEREYPELDFGTSEEALERLEFVRQPIVRMPLATDG